MNDHKHKIFPVNNAKHLTRYFRKILQNPRCILKPYVKDGMTVLDFGCGPGFFTVEAAKLVGEKGRVIAVDLQQEMLDLLAKNIKGKEIEKRITLYKCEEKKIGVITKVDVVIAFNVVHEVYDKNIFFSEIKNIVKPKGIVYLSEPSHRVDEEEFERTIKEAEKYGFAILHRPKVLLNRTVVLKNTF
jgi:ubiquinone/menaquinone biosynthesis C-methylase UbiE